MSRIFPLMMLPSGLLVAGVLVVLGSRGTVLGSGTGATGPGMLAECNGDLNGDGLRDLADAVFLLSYLFSSGPPPVGFDCGSCGNLPATGQTDCYEDDGTLLPDCDDPLFPGQDGFYQAGCPMAGRFELQTIDGVEVVGDHCTGLVWQSETADVNGDGELTNGPWPDGDRVEWARALQYCDSLGDVVSYGGSSEWRLPNIRELLSIVDFGASTPAISGGLVIEDLVMDSGVGAKYWSSTSKDGNTARAWQVIFERDARDHRLANGIDKSDYTRWVRAVRSECP